MSATGYDPAKVVEECVHAVPLAKLGRDHLDRIGDKRVTQARENLGPLLSDNEKVLFVRDSSFIGVFQNGMMVTDRAVYGSQLPWPVPLGQINSVEPAHETTGTISGGTIINGCLAYSGAEMPQWEVESLTQLAEHAREFPNECPAQEFDPGEASSLTDPDTLRKAYQITASAKSKDEVITGLQAAGFAREIAEKLGGGFFCIMRATSPWGQMQIAIGLAVSAAVIAMIMFLVIDTSNRIYALFPILIIGCLIGSAIAAYRAFKTRSIPAEDKVFDTWQTFITPHLPAS